jgi:hypothetical protein
MPYPTAASFRKHNRRSVGKVGRTAAHMATRMEASGVPAGEAIATANKYIGRHSSLAKPSRPRGRGLANR